jgi:hypothetical protein
MSNLVKVIDTLEARLAQSSIEFSFVPAATKADDNNNGNPLISFTQENTATAGNTNITAAATSSSVVKDVRTLRKNGSNISLTKRPQSAGPASSGVGAMMSQRPSTPTTTAAQEAAAKKAAADAAAKKAQEEAKRLQDLRDAEIRRKEEIFSKRNSCLYLYLLGNAYRYHASFMSRF